MAGDGVIGEAESEEVKRAKLLEVEAVKAAEGGSLGDALELLNQAITVAPNYASPYNNRAQVREREREREGGIEGGRETHILRERERENPLYQAQCLILSGF